ncbi:hypothetical protein [Bifidobacterium longum]|uniref:hypothetical protein n=1 Tax=Bifidobacterium longum TaxID=216816 RepID=UPI0015C3EEAA|nr:hypothetical protein [Bifidobacterium longum]
MDEQETQQPLAEMWFRGHAQSPSPIKVDGVEQPLTSMIERDPIVMVCRRGSAAFATALPYLSVLIYSIDHF